MIRRYGLYILFTILISLATAAHFSRLTAALSVEAVMAQRQTLLDLVVSYPLLALVVFTLAYVALAALALPGAAILSLLGGFLFGRWLGSALVLLSATTGALIVFALARSAIGEPLRRRAGPLYNKVARNMRENALGYLLFLRLIPIFPFFLVNLVAALFDIKARTFVLATFIGIAPATFIYVNIGRELGTASSIRELVSPRVLIALTGLGLLALAPVLYRLWRRGKSTSATSSEA